MLHFNCFKPFAEQEHSHQYFKEAMKKNDDTPKTETASRIKQLRKEFAKRGLEGVIVFDSLNIRYLSGFTGEFALMLIAEKGCFLILHHRNIPRAERETSNCEIIPIESEELIHPDDLLAKAFEISHAHEITELGVDPSLSHERLLAIRKKARPIKIKISDCVEACRQIKSSYEIKMISKAQIEAEEILRRFINEIKPGKSERQLHHLLLRMIHENELLEGPSFLPIIASGESGWGIHSYYTERKIRKNDSVIIDMGVKYKGYCSDMTRTVFIGKPTSKMKVVYEAVLEAQKAVEAVVKPGMYNHSVDAAAREVIGDSGFSPFFSHGLGHSIGMSVHEGPYLSYVKKREIIRENMVFTLEPGIYLQNKFGVRIEDIVALTDSGCKNLTGFPKEILVI